jgi:hypothetical protein
MRCCASRIVQPQEELIFAGWSGREPVVASEDSLNHGQVELIHAVSQAFANGKPVSLVTLLFAEVFWLGCFVSRVWFRHGHMTAPWQPG